MKLVIFGANGRTGRILTQRALAAHHSVTAVTRRPEDFPLRDPGLTVFQGDALDPASTDQAVAGADAVLSVLGVPYGRKPISIYSQGIENIIRAMGHHRVRRLICVTSTAVDHRYDNGGGFFFEKILKPLIAASIGRTTYADQARMERLVQDSGLDWTVIRPSGLFEAPQVTAYDLTDGYTTGKFTSRLDLAACILSSLEEESSFRKTLALATVALQPSLLRMMLKEAIPHRRNTLTPAA